MRVALKKVPSTCFILQPCFDPNAFTTPIPSHEQGAYSIYIPSMIVSIPPIIYASSNAHYLHATFPRSSLALANYLHATLSSCYVNKIFAYICYLHAMLTRYSLALANYLCATLTRSSCTCKHGRNHKGILLGD